ncbi:hypothetical protein [Burkholderia multivorans]|uniref:hypothetical protein n=1 Tax=Burkholderia multivorans TaxID=87883 RepID=UPI0021C127AF|nr:hypothetical protein [Burkholderia multivorans]
MNDQQQIRSDALTDERRNGTGAEVAQWQMRLKDRSSPVVDHWVNISPDGAKTLMEKYTDVYEVRALYAAPQPAQADALAEAREPAKVDTKARMDWAVGILRKLPPLDPTYSIISILDDHDREDRDEVLHSIRVFADMRATQALFTLYRAPADSGEARLTDEPSLKNPLTPYGMLVRALRIVAETALGEMAKHLGCSPATLSAVEFGRKPLTAAMVADTAAYFSSVGIPDTLHALSAAWRAHALVDGADHAA